MERLLKLVTLVGLTKVNPELSLLPPGFNLYIERERESPETGLLYGSRDPQSASHTDLIKKKFKVIPLSEIQVKQETFQGSYKGLNLNDLIICTLHFYTPTKFC